MRIKKMDSKSIILHEETEVKFKTAGNTREVQFSAGVNRRCPIQNISKDKYLDRETGEIKERKKSENRYQSPKSVRKSINKLMDLIRCNATETSYCKWLTLTYADAKTNHEKVYEDGKIFLRRLQRYLNNQTDLSDGQKTFKRITVAEPQGEKHDNSWHLHILLIFEDVAPFIINDTITELWGHGITDTHKVYDADGLALYFKVYLSDVEYTEGDENYDVVKKAVNRESKQFIKGGRLKYYPTGMPLFSASRGMSRPMVEKISHKEAMERVSDFTLVYQETFLIGDECKVGNIIDKRYYKKQ
ncbi:hypothetical protein R2R35_17920 [Anaerocolumna sp. AGMB13020]|uniref:rolling circle replication-associated protein n=1 Tax=Anaerocolumna sp. AGMB13020 TaxID=3081750 RepID=UPI002955C924|nr:hypothetical protein [Anaerocolumna sp. AGMB13020]WOO35661.1 hypothetical protein R2R35_17920 [Anaerocolumna sp. AGMB13020]